MNLERTRPGEALVGSIPTGPRYVLRNSPVHNVSMDTAKRIRQVSRILELITHTERRCAHCKQPIPPRKRPGARFCKPSCRVNHHLAGKTHAKGL